MQTLKYKVITSKSQYKDYCNQLEQLVFSAAKNQQAKDEIALLTLLVEKWDACHNSFTDADPVQLLHSFIASHNLKAKDLVEILGISKGYVSDILNYKKGFSKEVIRKLAAHFKITQEAFNRPYKLLTPLRATSKSAAVAKTKRKLAVA